MFTQEQRDGWAKIVDSVHAKGASIFSQAWHQGRSAHSYFLGTQPVSSSDVAADGNVMWGGVSMPCEKPRSMTVVDIERTQSDFVNAAKNARSIGFDGVEIHAGNGYLFDQFHHSNGESDLSGGPEQLTRTISEPPNRLLRR
jgi:2,4-dienoyl-CoA reductase-like NADH-dependent reductase (Old Yellow Enzyme family)